MLILVKSRAKNVLSNEAGSSNVEVIIWIAVVLLIGSALYFVAQECFAWKLASEEIAINNGLSTDYRWN